MLPTDNLGRRDWSAILAEPGVRVLQRSVDFQASPHNMAVQVRRAVARHGARAKVSYSNKRQTVTITVTGG